MKTFDALQLSPQLLKAIEELKFKEPTTIQALAIPKILSDVNLIGQAPTGTGKTLSYLLPIFCKIYAENPSVQALILSPTYELAMQTARTSQELAKLSGLEIRSLGLIGGANISRQIDSLKKKPHIIVGSTGRILELSRKHKLNLSSVKILVLDEFDRLLDDQNFDMIKEVITLLPNNFQCLMFSATAPKKALKRADTLGTFELIKVNEDNNLTAKCEHFYKVVDFRDKITELRKLSRRLPIHRGLVFINKNFDAVITLDKLRYDGLKVESLIGTKDKMSRKQAIMDFKAGKVQLLLSTDLAARGLDIENIDYVINLNFPESAQMYLHRAGRTARAGASGKVITLVDQKEINKLRDLEKELKVKLNLI